MAFCASRNTSRCGCGAARKVNLRSRAPASIAGRRNAARAAGGSVSSGMRPTPHCVNNLPINGEAVATAKGTESA